MAKTANNKKAGGGKSGSGGKSGQGKKTSSTKGARARSVQRAQQKAKAARPAEKKGFMKFLRDVRVEMGKVTWPTRKDLAQSTLVVLVAVAIATVYTGVLDFVFEKALNFVVNILT